GRIKRCARLRAVHALDDHRVVAHGAADEAALAGKGGRCTLAHDPQIAPVMRLAPGIVVVVVHGVGDRAADDGAHALNHPLAAGIGVAAGELHGGDVAAAELAVLVDHGRRHVHAVLAAGGLE